MNYSAKNIFGFPGNPFPTPSTLSGTLNEQNLTVSYLYNTDLYESHKFLKPYIDAIYHGGAICQDLIRHSSYLREEDYIPSSIGFIPTRGKYIFFL